MYQITVTNGKYFVDGVEQSSLNLYEGQTYVFDWSNATGHPLRFSTTSDGIHASGVEYTEGVFVDTANFTTTITVAENAPDLHYYCQYHSGMGGSIVTPISPNVEIKDKVISELQLDLYLEANPQDDSVLTADRNHWFDGYNVNTDINLFDSDSNGASR